MTLSDRLKDWPSTIPGLLAVVGAACSYVVDYSHSHTWPPSGIEIALFISGLINVFATLSKPKPPATP